MKNLSVQWSVGSNRIKLLVAHKLVLKAPHTGVGVDEGAETIQYRVQYYINYFTCEI
jgi:hypothetical protein